MATSPTTSTFSNSNSTSSSDDTTDLLITTPVKLSRMILEPEMPQILSRTFHTDQAALAVLRQYHFISQTQQNLRNEIARHNTERSSLFQLLMRRNTFQNRMFPVLTEYRRMRSSLSPYEASPTIPAVDNPHSFGNPLPPLVERQSPSSTTSELEDDNVSSFSKVSQRTVEIIPEESINEDRTNSSEDSIISFYTANTNESGTRENPIDIDLIPEQLTTHSSRPTSVRRTQFAPITMQCTVCCRRGHTVKCCLQLGPVFCTYCREVGHFANDCLEWRADIRRYYPELQFCIICNEVGHTLNQCATLRSFY